MKDINDLFRSFEKLKVGVVGDIMLDTYMWGRVERISPEAPVPVVSITHKEHRIGGAGNVALNCRSLGAQTTVLSLTGIDDDAERLEQLLLENEIDAGWLVKSESRMTTNKTRIISRNQQMMRLDSEITIDLPPDEETIFIRSVSGFINSEKPDVLIFEDYNKGLLTERVIREVIMMCREKGILTTVDPKRKNFFSYKNADIFKPNLKEVKDGLNLLFDDIDENLLRNIHDQLVSVIGHRISLITLSEKGIFCEKDGQSFLLPSHIRNIADVSGAGDTVISVASLVYAVTRDLHLMAEMANLAGGIVCEEVGTVAIKKERLLEESKELLY